MLKNKTMSSTLNKVLSIKPPKLLFHYTSPDGLIGILKNKEIWATNAIFQNDEKEQKYAAEIAKDACYNIKNTSLREDEEAKKLVDELKKKAGSAAPRIYIASFSEEENLLSQWRAYCPNGGYSIGFPSNQLHKMAIAQKFYLSKCIYDRNEQNKIVYEIIYSFINEFKNRKKNGMNENENYEKTAWEFSQYLSQFGTVIKHPQFSEEAEWRIISKKIPENHDRIEFRGGNGIVIPYYKFQLTNDENPDLMDVEGDKLKVMAGPSNYDLSIRSTATSFVMRKYLGKIHKSVSSIPYRISH